MRSLALPFAALLLSGCAAATVQPSSYLEILEGTTRVTCRGAGMDGAFGSRLARGPMLVAPQGERAAWVEVEAQAIPVDSDEGSCQNVSRLWVRESGASAIAFVQKPGWEGRNGNAIDLVDWSADGSRLLLELHTWTYPTDPVDPTLLVWDARTREVEQVEAGARVAERFGGACGFRARGRGFAADGSIVVAVEPRDDAAAGCAGAPRLWKVSAAGDALAAETEFPPRWGRVAVAPPRTRAVDPD